MKIFKPICLLVIVLLFLTSCADTNPSPQSFNQFLYNHSSMTKQLESLDNNLQVHILYSGMDKSSFKRIVSLNLSTKPVLVGLSQANTNSPYFVDVLKNADTMPIGKVLFAANSGVLRDPKMEVNEIGLDSISDSTVRQYIAGLGYTNNDIIYKRTSIFRKNKQYLQVIEYILPSIHDWIK